VLCAVYTRRSLRRSGARPIAAIDRCDRLRRPIAATIAPCKHTCDRRSDQSARSTCGYNVNIYSLLPPSLVHIVNYSFSQISDYFIHLNLPKFNHFSYHLVIFIFPIAAIDRRDRSPRVNIVLATTDIEERWRIRSTLEVCGNDFLVPIPFPLPSNHSHSITTHSHSNTAFPFPFFPSPLFLLPPIPVPISSSDIYRLS